MIKNVLNYVCNKAGAGAAWAAKGGLGAVGGLLAFFVALNVAGQMLYLRFDLSEGKVYSPSKASKRILKSLEDPVVIKCYFCL